MSKLRFYCGVSAAAVAVAALASTSAWAADDATKPTTVEEVVVTGSLIAGTPKTTAIPIAVIGQEELEKRGSPSVLDVIKSLPIIGPVLGDSNHFPTAARGRKGGGQAPIIGAVGFNGGGLERVSFAPGARD